MSASPHRLTLYSKAECSLCDKAKAALDAVRAERAFELSVVDIAADPQLFEKYRYDIPVLLIDGVEAARHFIGAEKVRVLLKRADEAPSNQQ